MKFLINIISVSSPKKLSQIWMCIREGIDHFSIAFYPPSWNIFVIFLHYVVLYYLIFNVFPDGEQGLCARSVTIKELKLCCESSGIEFISQSTDFISLIRLPIKYPFTWTEGTGSFWQTPPAIQILIQTFAVTLLSSVHLITNIWLFYRPMISHRNKAICLTNIFSHTVWSE